MNKDDVPPASEFRPANNGKYTKMQMEMMNNITEQSKLPSHTPDKPPQCDCGLYTFDCGYWCPKKRDVHTPDKDKIQDFPNDSADRKDGDIYKNYKPDKHSVEGKEELTLLVAKEMIAEYRYEIKQLKEEREKLKIQIEFLLSVRDDEQLLGPKKQN